MKGIKYTDPQMRGDMEAPARARHLASARAARAHEKLCATPEWQAEHAAARERHGLQWAQLRVVERRAKIRELNEWMRTRIPAIRRLRERHPKLAFPLLPVMWRSRRCAQQDLRKAIADLAALESAHADKTSP